MSKDKFLILHLTDMHLLDKETKSTKKQVDNTILMLDSIIDTIKTNEDIKMVTFGGDIQDRVPNNLYFVDIWKQKFKKIKEIMLDRIEKDGIKFKYMGLTREQEDLHSKGLLTPIVSSRGNHDYVKTLKTKSNKKDIEERKNYTFFDSLLLDNLIINPTAVAFKHNNTKVYFDNRNFGEAGRELNKKISDNFTVIASYHDNVVTAESSLWQLKSVDLYQAEEVMNGVDLGIVNHIHKNQDPLIIETECDKDTVMWQVGSLGRMKLNEDETRDVGYSALIDVDDVQNPLLIEFDLIPVDEYFDFERAMRKKTLKKSLKSLNLGSTEIKRNQISASEEVRNLTKESVNFDVSDELFSKMINTAVDILEDIESDKK